jgi:predicted RNA-binding Zn-ribbon protein involved in translation (DUF1610 family)
MKIYGPYLSYADPAKPRRIINIHDDDGRRIKSTSYARYLMEQHLGRELGPREWVDHIDDDQLNDVIENLQILSPGENTWKGRPAAEQVTFACPVCGEMTTKAASKVRHNRKQGKAGPFCGKVCSRKYQVEQSKGS